MKVPCRITGSSHQDFDFEISCKNTDPKGETLAWLVDSLQKPQHVNNFLFLNSQLWIHILRNEIRPKYAVLLKHLMARVILHYNSLL